MVHSSRGFCKLLSNSGSDSDSDSNGNGKDRKIDITYSNHFVGEIVSMDAMWVFGGWTDSPGFTNGLLLENVKYVEDWNLCKFAALHPLPKSTSGIQKNDFDSKLRDNVGDIEMKNLSDEMEDYESSDDEIKEHRNNNNNSNSKKFETPKEFQFLQYDKLEFKRDPESSSDDDGQEGKEVEFDLSGIKIKREHGVLGDLWVLEQLPCKNLVSKCDLEEQGGEGEGEGEGEKSILTRLCHHCVIPARDENDIKIKNKNCLGMKRNSDYNLQDVYEHAFRLKPFQFYKNTKQEREISRTISRSKDDRKQRSWNECGWRWRRVQQGKPVYYLFIYFTMNFLV